MDKPSPGVAPSPCDSGDSGDVAANGFDPAALLRPRPEPHPRDRGWIIVHPAFPLGFKHFLDPHQQPERPVVLDIPWLGNFPVGLVFKQITLQAWDDGNERAATFNGDMTGAVLWRAAEALSVHVLERWSGADGSVSRPLRVLELGCGGCALPSVAAALCGHRCVATDLAPPLALCRTNVASNLAEIAALNIPPPPLLASAGASAFGSVDVAELGWGQALPAKAWWAAGVDLVLASDVVYALPGKPVLFRQLAATLKLLMGAGGDGAGDGAGEGEGDGAGKEGREGVEQEQAHGQGATRRRGRAAVALFSYQHRSGAERRFFDEVLPAAGFACRTLETPSSGGGVLGASPFSNVRLVEVRLAMY